MTPEELQALQEQEATNPVATETAPVENLASTTAVAAPPVESTGGKTLEQYGAALAQSQGQNPEDPSIQQKITTTSAKLRQIYPGMSDEDIAAMMGQAAMQKKAELPPGQLQGMAGDRINKMFDAFQANYSPEMQARAEALYAKNAQQNSNASVLTSALGRGVGAGSAQAVADTENNANALGKDLTVGAFNRVRSAAGEQLKAAMTQEQFKQEQADLAVKRKEALDLSDPNSAVSVTSRTAMLSALKTMPQLAAAFEGQDLSKLSAGQIQKILPGLDPLIKTVELKIKADADREEKALNREREAARDAETGRHNKAEESIQRAKAAAERAKANDPFGLGAAGAAAGGGAPSAPVVDSLGRKSNFNQDLLDKIKAANPTMGAAVEQRLNGMGGMSPRSKLGIGVDSLAKQVDPDFDPQKANSYKIIADSDANIKGNTYGARRETYNTVTNHLDSLYEATKKLDNTSFTPVNSVINKAAEYGVGTKERQNAIGAYSTAQDLVAGEVSKAVANKAITEGEAQRILGRMGPNASPESIKGAVHEMAGLFLGRAEATQKQRDSNLTPYQASRLKPLIDPENKAKLETLLKNTTPGGTEAGGDWKVVK